MMKPTFDLNQIPVDHSRIERHTHGGVVFIKGDEGDHAYIVRSGRVEIRDGGRVLESMEPGELFGEMALIDAQARSASAVAVGSTELVIVDRDAFHALIRDVPDFAFTVMRLMARRLRAMNTSAHDIEAFLPIVQATGKSA